MKTDLRTNIRMVCIMLVLALTGGFPLCAQRIISRPLPFYYELPSNEIFDIYQDREGYIWMGTTGGVARYDGYRIRCFRSDYRDANLLTDNCSSAITDNAYYVWIGTRKGLNLYDKRTCRITPFPDTAFHSKDINYMITDWDDCVWIASGPHLYRSNPRADKLKEYELAPDTEENGAVNAVYVDRQGTVWALTNGRGLWKYDAERDLFTSCPPIGEKNAPYTLYQDNEDRYWIGTWSEGLWRFYPDRKTGCYERQSLRNVRTGEEEPSVYSLTQDDTYGYLWLLTYNALYALDLRTGKTPRPVDLQGIVDTGHMYTKVLKDREGCLWFSSYDQACTVSFDHSGTDYRSLSGLKRRFGQDANLLNLCVDKGGVAWMMQDRHGLCLYNLRQDSLTTDVSVPVSPNFIREARRKEGMWVFSYWGNEVMRLIRRGMDVRVAEKIPLPKRVVSKGYIEHMVEDRDGYLWVLSAGELYVSGAEGDIPGLAALTTAGDGQVMGITGNGHLYGLECRKGKVEARSVGMTVGLAADERAAYLCTDVLERVWMITTLGRVFRQDKGTAGLRHLGQDGRLEGGSVLGLVAEGDYVWIVTNKKALCYDIYRNTYREYATTDKGIGVRLFRYRAFCTDGRGGLYIGGHKGMVHIPADGSVDTGLEARPMVTEVRVDGAEVFFGDRTRLDGVRHVTLEADAHNVELCFSTLQYAPSVRVRMAYKLDGVDRDWTYLDYGKSTAHYNRLGKGTYTFRLKTEYGKGVWSEAETVLTLTRLPAFYETWWAYGIYACLAIGGIGLALRSYIRHKGRENKVEVKVERTETSVPDDESANGRFLRELTECIETRLERSDFDVPTLAREMGMSKSTLRRKLLAITGQTPQEFVRAVRMKRACTMLAGRRMTVSEVAYAVGFANPKYFSKCFKEEFGVTPTEYCERLKKAKGEAAHKD